MKTKLIAGLVLTSATALLTTTPASANVSCSVTSGPAPKLDVNLSAANDHAVIEVDDFTYVRVNGNQCFDPAINPATTTTIDEVRVKDTSGASTEVEISQPAEFTPGDTPELGNSEIEFAVDFGTGTNDVLTLNGNDGGDDRFVAGANGINVNKTDSFPDVDIVATDHEQQVFNGGGGVDHLSAGGNDGPTGGPSTVRTRIYAGADSDWLVAGSAQDFLGGGTGNDHASFASAPAGVTVDLRNTEAQDTGGSDRDTLDGIESATGSAFDDRLTGPSNVPTSLLGGAGDDVLIGTRLGDVLHGDAGNDTLEEGGGGATDIIEGGPDLDTVSYARTEGKVRVDLNKTTQTTLSGGFDEITQVENIDGTAYADELTGTPDDNVITGGAGKDTIDAYGGPDVIHARDDEADIVNCGDGADSVTTDRAGTDTLAGCETADFTPEPPTADPGTPADPSTQSTPGTGTPSTPGQTTPPPALDTTILLRLGGSKSQAVLRNRYVKLTGTCPAEHCTLSARPVLKIAKKGRKKAITRALPAVQSNLLPAVQRTLKVKLTNKDIATLRAAKKRRAKATITITVTARDGAGNTTTATRTIALR